ncbi:MAG: adenylate/guanylate cyclase domain-containing protein [Anaerolineae bacterium]|nr:adenylate/guanylate cyclase domain-containing protein [Anaerolineae bacterium]
MLALIGLMGLQLATPTWSARLEAWTVDARFHLRGAQPSTQRIVIVAVDEASFQLLGDLQGENIRSWPRARWADLVDRLAADEARLIGLDIVFDTPGWDPGGDAALAQALSAAGNGVLPSHRIQSQVGEYSLATHSPPLHTLAQAAAGVGVADFPTDADGAIRRLTLLYPGEASPQPAFALVLATLAQGSPIDIPAADLAPDLSLSLNFRGPEGSFTTLSLYDVLTGAAPPESLRGALVLVGYTTLLEQDRHPTPFGGELGMPGIEIQANALDTLLTGDWLRTPPSWFPLVTLSIAGALALLLVNAPRPGWGLFGITVLWLTCIALSSFVFARANLLLPLIPGSASAFLVTGVAVAERLIFAERDKRRLHARFSGIMSAERLHAVMEHWEDLMRPDRPATPAAVLFADIRGFTHATEYLSREGRTADMFRFLSHYLDVMSGAIFAEGGVIYRVFGDGLLVLFGLPEALPDYPQHAVRTAVRMAMASETLQEQWPLRDEAPFGMGIGIHCGPIVDAVVGRGRQLDYSVIGDCVNAAARIESHCKVAMEVPRPTGGQVPANTTILLSADLHALVEEQVLADMTIPPFEARGKSEPLQVVRVLGWREVL